MTLYERFLNSTMRTKFILVLLFTNLITMSVVGGLAYWRLQQKFDKLIAEDASKRFADDVSAYFKVYGTWQNGLKRERFRNFAERRSQFSAPRPPTSTTMIHDLGANVAPSERAQPSAVQDNNTPKEIKAFPKNEPPPKVSNLNRPLFRFYLFDANYKALMALSPYQIGDAIRPKEKAKAVPILTRNKIVAYYTPQAHVNYSDLDLGYLAAMRESLMYGLMVGVVLTLLLGAFFGNQISRALGRLTAAAQAMSNGDLRQHIALNSTDEVGILAKSFNKMSADLANNYAELQESHAQIEQQAAQLRELSIRDALTGLYNRRHFDAQAEQMLKQATRYQRPFSVMIGDIDFFKKINDNFSHAIGDAVLKEIGQLMQNSMRTNDLVARYGGEEFVIAFPETPLAQAQAACEALRKTIASYDWQTLNPALKVTMSMGISAAVELGDVHSMLQQADVYLYEAKNAGRNRVWTATETATLLEKSS